MSISTITSASSKTDHTLNDTPATVATDHTYSSPAPKPMQESSSEAKPASDHTYAEYSDTPTEPYGSDTEQALDSVSTGVTKDGRLIVASTDKLEISVEYLNSTTLLEATGTSQNVSEMLLDASNAGIVRASPDKNKHLPVPDETANHEALLEATAAPEPQDVSLTDETQRLLSDKPNPVDKRLPDATDTTDLSKAQLPDETLDVLPDGTHPNSPTLPDETVGTKERTCNHIESPEATEILPLQVPDDDMTEQNKTTADNTDQGSVLLVKPDNATTETNSPAKQEKTESDSTPPVSESDVTAQPCQNGEALGVTTTLSPLPKLETSKEHTDATETTTEQIIGEISYMEHSDDFHSVKSSSDVPSNFKLVETLSVVSELPEFSHTPDTTVTNNTNGSSGLSPPQRTGSPDNNNIDTTDSSGNSRTKWRRLKTCIIRLMELSNQEREQWMSGTSQTTSTPSLTSSSYDGSSASTNDSRYNMRVRLRTPVTRSTGRKRASVNYVEQGAHGSGCDSDYEAKLKPQQPLDNKSYPSVSWIATQWVIETNRASKQTMMPNTITLPAATESLQGPVQANKQTMDNSVLPESTNDVGALSIPHKTDGNNSDLPDETITQPKNVLPDATNPQSPDAKNDSTAEPKQSVDETAS